MGDSVDQYRYLATALAGHLYGLDGDVIHDAIIGTGTVNDQYRLARSQAGASEHGRRRRGTAFTKEGKAVTRRRAVKRQHTVVSQHLEGAREGIFPRVGHRVINIAASGLFCSLDESLARLSPCRPLRGVIRHGSEDILPSGILAINGGTTGGVHPCRTVVTGHHAQARQATGCGTAQTVVTGARGCALHKQALAGFYVEGSEQRPLYGAHGQSVGASFLKGERAQLGVQLGALHGEKLSVGAVVALIALYAEVRSHGVKALVR